MCRVPRKRKTENDDNPYRRVSGKTMFWPNKSSFEVNALYSSRCLLNDDWQRFEINRVLKKGNILNIFSLCKDN